MTLAVAREGFIDMSMRTKQFHHHHHHMLAIAICNCHNPNQHDYRLGITQLTANVA